MHVENVAICFDIIDFQNSETPQNQSGVRGLRPLLPDFFFDSRKRGAALYRCHHCHPHPHRRCCRKQTIESQDKYKFLRELVANVPDHQVEEEGGSSVHNNGEESASGALSGRRPRGRSVQNRYLCDTMARFMNNNYDDDN